MQKMILTMIIEGTNEEVQTMKGKIFATACGNMVSCSTHVLPDYGQELKIPKMNYNDKRGYME